MYETNLLFVIIFKKLYLVEYYLCKYLNHLVDLSPWPNNSSRYGPIFFSSLYFKIVCLVLILVVILLTFMFYHCVSLSFCLINKVQQYIFLFSFFFYPVLLAVLICVLVVFLISDNKVLLADSFITLNESLDVREEQFWLKLNAGNADIASRIAEIYSSNDRYFLYSYIAADMRFYFPVYPEIAIQVLHEISLNFKPDLIIGIVDAARLHAPDYNTNWEPPAEYWLSQQKARLWMYYAPTLPRNCAYQAEAILDRLTREVLAAGNNKRVWLPIDESILIKRSSFFDRFKNT